MRRPYEGHAKLLRKTVALSVADCRQTWPKRAVLIDRAVVRKGRQLRLTLKEGRLFRPVPEETKTVPFRHPKRLRPRL
jgi:hypothetical protein